MSRPLFLAIADLHIRNSGEYLFASKPFIKGDLIYAINQVCDFIKKYKPRGVIIAGDFFHSKKITAGDLELALQLIDACKEYADDIFYVQGQHDRFDPQFISVLEKDAIHLHKNLVKYHNRKIYGCDYVGQDIYSVLEEMPEVDYFVTHQTWKERPNDIFGYITIRELSAKARITISGDIHTHCLNSTEGTLIYPELHEKKYQFDKMFLSPGSICPQRLDVKESCGAFLIRDEAGAITVENIRIETRPIRIIKIYTPENVKQFVDYELDPLLQNCSKLPEPINIPILIFKSTEMFPEINELSCQLEGKAFVFFQRDVLQQELHVADSIRNSIAPLDLIIADVFKHNIHKESVLRLLNAAKNGDLMDELNSLANEVREAVEKEIGQ